MSTNIVKVHNLKDSSIQRNQFSRYHLNILIRRDGFALAVLDSGLNRYTHFEAFKPVIPNDMYYTSFSLQEISDHIGNQLTVLDFSNKDFASVKVVYESNINTLVPQDLFEKGKEKVYLDFVHGQDSKNHYFSNLIKIISSYNIFSVPDQFIAILDKHFKEYKIFNQADALICSLIKHYITFTGNIIFLNARFREFDLMLMNSGKLRYFNSFSFNEPNDFLYYILNFTNQYKINNELADIVLIDEISDDSKNYRILTDYFRNVEFIKRNPEFHYSSAFNIIPEHAYYTLFSIGKCE